MKCACQESWSSWIDPKCPNHGPSPKFTERNEFSNMTKEHAMVIRALRVSGCTWGRISEIMQVVTNTSLIDEFWGQMAGHDMCRKASEILNDDPEFTNEDKRLYERLKKQIEKTS